MDAFEQGPVLAAQADQEGGVGKVVTSGDGGVMNLRSVGRDHPLCGLVITPRHTRSVMAHTHAQLAQRLQVVPVFPVDAKGGRHQPEHAGLAGLLAGVALIEAAGGAPGLHRPHQAQQ